jgi:hypothetical protein
MDRFQTETISATLRASFSPLHFDRQGDGNKQGGPTPLSNREELPPAVDPFPLAQDGMSLF